MQIMHGSCGLLPALSLLAAAFPLAAQCANGPSFGPPASTPDSTNSVFKVVVGDFDRDGDEDLVARVAPNVELYRNDGAAAFTPVLTLGGLSGSLHDVVTGDFDRDGWLDLAVTEYRSAPGGTSAHVRTLRNTGVAGGFVAFVPGIDVMVSPPGPGLAAARVASADVDADGVLDLVADDGRNLAAVLLGESVHGAPTGTFAAPVSYPWTSGTLTALVVADLDADGALDVVNLTGMRVLPGLKNAAGRPLGTFGPAVGVPGFTSYRAALADIDRDGLPDVVFVDGGSAIAIARNLGGFAFAPPVLFAHPGSSPETPFVADLDRDGWPDVAVPSLENSLFGPNFRVLRDPFGAAAWSGHGHGLGYPQVGTAADLDRDGLVDVVVGKIAPRVSVAFGQCASTPAPGITVVAPNGGEAWVAGTLRTIQWTAAAPVAAFDVDVSFDDGATWAPVARRVVGTSVPWWVHEPSSNRARVRVMPSDVPVFGDTSDGRFTVGGPGLAAAVPFGAGCGVPSAPVADATVPRLGGTAALELSGATPGALGAWWLSLPAAAPLPLGGGCFAHLEPAALALLVLAPTTAAGELDHAVPVPPHAALQGVVVAVQATVFPPTGPLPLHASNAVAMTLGF